MDPIRILKSIVPSEELKYCSDKKDFECLAEYYHVLDYLLIIEADIYNRDPASFERRKCIVRDALTKLNNLTTNETIKKVISRMLNDPVYVGECEEGEFIDIDRADEIRKIVWDGGISNDGLKSLEFVLYVIDFPSIQGFVYSPGGKLLDVQGASIIVDAVCKLIGNYVRENLGREFLVQDDAGEIVIVLPKSIKDKAINELKRYLSSTPLFKLVNLRTNEKHTIKANLEEIIDPERGIFGKIYRAALSLLDFPSINGSTSLHNEVIPRNLCQVCHNEEAVDPFKDDSLIEVFGDLINDEIINNATKNRGIDKIGRECLVKRIYALAYRKSLQGEKLPAVSRLGIDKTLIYNFQKLLDEYLGLGSIGGERYPSDLDDYNYITDNKTRNAYIALIHGDGDGFGSKKINTKTITGFRLLSLLYKFIMTFALMNAASKAINDHYEFFHPAMNLFSQVYYYPLITIYFGGDDFVAIGRAEILISFLKGFSEGLKELYDSNSAIIEQFRKLLDLAGVDRITVSISSSIGKTKTPIFLLYESSQILLRHIKETGRGIRGRYGIKADFVLFRGTFSRSYMKRIVDASRRVGERSLIVIADGYNGLNYIDLSSRLVGCNTSEEKYPLISTSDLAEYVELGFEGEASGEWLLLKIAYDASREKIEDKADFYKNLVNILWEIHNSDVWVILLKFLDILTIYDNLASFYPASQSIWQRICSEVFRGVSG